MVAGGYPGDYRERGWRVPGAGATVALQEHRPRRGLHQYPQLQGEGRAGSQRAGSGHIQGELQQFL